MRCGYMYIGKVMKCNRKSFFRKKEYFEKKKMGRLFICFWKNNFIYLLGLYKEVRNNNLEKYGIVI